MVDRLPEGVSRFQEWWDKWPANGQAPFTENVRKKNRKGCEKKWREHKFDAIADTIIRDTEQRCLYDKNWRANKGTFIPLPMTYLNQEHWNDGEFADIRSERNASRVEEGIDLNRVVEWIKSNKRLTEKQITSQWQWIWDGHRVIGVQIPDMAPLMFKSFKVPRGDEAQAA